MNILLLGSKEYPFHSSYKYDKYAGGGIEVHVEKLAKYLILHKYNVFIITRLFPELKRVEIRDNLDIIRVNFINNRLLRTFSYNFLSFFYAIKIISKEKIDIVHCHGPIAGLFGVLIKILTNKLNYKL